MFRKAAVFLTVVGAVIAGWASMAAACGGFFCQTNPVDQVGERIVFTANADGTITTLIEILYQGSAEDFSWILPIPEAIAAEDLQVPDDGQAVFDELHQLTDVRFRAPGLPECAQNFFGDEEAMEDEEEAMEDEEGGVEIFDSGQVGPFGFDIIGSSDSNALLDWLVENNYRVTPEMEPLIDLYVEEESAFIAMRLLDGETAESIQPIEITYPGTEPTIPLRLTAVAAQRDMPIWVWIFGQDQAESTNFANMKVETEEITFFVGGGNDYTFLVQQRADAFDGQAFITEYARELSPADFDHPWLASQSEGSPWLTRMSTFIDPDEMTLDPAFGFHPELEEVLRWHDGTGLTGLYSCERDNPTNDFVHAIDPTGGTGRVVAFTPDPPERPEVESADDSASTDDDSGDQNAAADTGSSDSSGGIGGVVLLLIPVALLAGLFVGLRLRE